jgi:hypothetical protein
VEHAAGEAVPAAASLSRAFHRALKGGKGGVELLAGTPEATRRRGRSPPAGISCGRTNPVAATRRPTSRRAARSPHGIACGSHWHFSHMLAAGSRPQRIRAGGSGVAGVFKRGKRIFLFPENAFSL